jgi:hypothetical protein
MGLQIIPLLNPPAAQTAGSQDVLEGWKMQLTARYVISENKVCFL